MPKLKINVRAFRGHPAPGIKLPFPLGAKLRPAQLRRMPRFQAVDPFLPERWEELETYRPHVLIGDPADLQRLAEQVELGMIRLASVDHAIVVMTHLGAKPLDDQLRVTLWQSFGVPLYELYIGPDHRLAASECEAHDGWHLEAGVQFALQGEELLLENPGAPSLRTGLTGSLDDSPCPCGRTTARVKDIEALNSNQRTLRVLAVSA